MNISIIVATDVSLRGAIGSKGIIPWHISSDMKRFARLTNGHPVIMGRKTYDSIIKKIGHPLRGRTNIVLTRQDDFFAPGCIITYSIENALAVARSADGNEEIFIIGGEEIYNQFFPLANKIYYTLVLTRFKEPDAFFPRIDIYDVWKNKWLIVKLKRISKSVGNDFDSIFFIGVKNKNLNHEHTRNDIQKALMKKIEADEVCPFCPENIKKYHPKPILKKGKYWFVTENMNPYNGTKLHLLFIYKDHIADISQLNSLHMAELMDLAKEFWISDDYIKLSGGGLFMRFGDSDNTGATVSHLHAHMIAGEASLDDQNIEPLKVRLGYKFKK